MKNADLDYLLENPDGCNDPRSLMRAATRARKLGKTALADYCTEKGYAVRARLEGRINDALRHESNAQKAYDDLPQDQVW